MTQNCAPTLVHGAAAATLSTHRPGWHLLLCFARPAGIEVQLLPLGADADDPCPASVMGRAVAVGREHANAKKRKKTVFRATAAGWHRIRATVRPQERGVQITATWESAVLSTPARVMDPVRNAEQPEAEWWGWIEAPKREALGERCDAARDLARYFIVDRNGSRITAALRELRGNPYPKLSQLNRDHEKLLITLARQPETLTHDDWDTLQNVGRRTLELLGRETVRDRAA